MDKSNQKLPFPLGHRRSLQAMASTCEDRDRDMYGVIHEPTVPSPNKGTHCRDIEMKERLHAIASLRDLVVQQKKTIGSLKKKQGDYRKALLRVKNNRHHLSLEHIREEISSIVSEVDSHNDASWDTTEPSEPLRKRVVSFEKKLENTDEDVISAVTCEMARDSFVFEDASEMGDDFKETIAAIQEQASQIDTVIALDRLETVKNDLREITKQLQHRTVDVDELKDQVARLEGRNASLQLERDLFEAEAKRSKADLRSCIQHMASRHFNQPPSRVQESPDVLVKPSQIRTAKTLDTVDTTPDTRTCRGHSTDTSSGGEQFVVANETAETANSFSDLDIANGWESCPTRRTLDATDSDGESIDRTVGNTSNAPLLPPKCVRSAARSPRRSSESRHLGLCFWRHRKQAVVDKGPTFARMDDDDVSKRTRLPQTGSGHKHGSSRPAKRRNEKKRSSLTTNVDELSGCLAAETFRADELRKRLSSTSRYYDNIVHSLQQNVGILQSAKQDVASDGYTRDMINQLSLLDREKRAILTRLRAREGAIAQLEKSLKGATRRNCPQASKSQVTKRRSQTIDWQETNEQLTWV